jgi:hypothetical protein
MESSPVAGHHGVVEGDGGVLDGLIDGDVAGDLGVGVVGRWG